MRIWETSSKLYGTDNYVTRKGRVVQLSVTQRSHLNLGLLYLREFLNQQIIGEKRVRQKLTLLISLLNFILIYFSTRSTCGNTDNENREQ